MCGDFSCPEWHRVFSWSYSHSFQGCLCLPWWPFLSPIIINKVMWNVPDVIRDAAHIFYHSALFIAEGGIMISGWNPLPSAACWSIGLQNISNEPVESFLEGDEDYGWVFRNLQKGLKHWKTIFLLFFY